MSPAASSIRYPMPRIELELPSPRWAQPHHQTARYRGCSGGRASGKAHFFAELLVERTLGDPELRVVCIREVQKSLKFSAKSLIAAKIRGYELEAHYEITSTEIRRRGGSGVIIFAGMQNHTADSLRSLDAFRVAWVEEAQRLSERSLQILLPTIREPGSEVWFSWNPVEHSAPVDAFFRSLEGDGRAIHTHSTYLDNPFCPSVAREEAERMRRLDPDAYAHIWLGEYQQRSDARVLGGRWRLDEFVPGAGWDGPYYGLDFGFSLDPTAATRSWVWEDRLWVEYEAGGVGLVIDDTEQVLRAMPGGSDHVWRADAASPDRIEELRRRGLRVRPAAKGPGSVEAGVEYLRNFSEIVIHERCVRTAEEARLWSYRTDRLTGDPLPQLADGHDHYWDSVRYAHAPMIHRARSRVRLIV